jgi:leader peptidase (prepilin peptidase)/N-methyltransferase
MSDIPAGVGGAIAFVFGACIGSFVNVVAFRLPRDLSIVRPRSFCPRCEQPIPMLLNIPILGYIGLRGKCLLCGGPIPLRYFLCEITLAIASLYLYFTFPILDGLARFALCAALFAASLIDYDWRIIPDIISIPGIPIGILAATFLIPEVGLKRSLIGFVIGGGFLFAVAELYRVVRGQEGMGMGDVKLVAMIGAFLGWPAVLFTLSVGSLLGSVGGLAVALFGSREPPPKADGAGTEALVTREPAARDEADKVPILQTTVPFGPFLSLAAGCYALFEPQLINWYLSR